MKLNPKFMAIVEQIKRDPDCIKKEDFPNAYEIDSMPIILLEDEDIDLGRELLDQYCTANSHKYENTRHFLKYAKSRHTSKNAYWEFPTRLINFLSVSSSDTNRSLVQDVNETFNREYWADVHHSLMTFKEYVRQHVALEEAENSFRSAKLIIGRFSVDKFLAKHEEWKLLVEVK